MELKTSVIEKCYLRQVSNKVYLLAIVFDAFNQYRLATHLYEEFL